MQLISDYLKDSRTQSAHTFPKSSGSLVCSVEVNLTPRTIEGGTKSKDPVHFWIESNYVILFIGLFRTKNII